MRSPGWTPVIRAAKSVGLLRTSVPFGSRKLTVCFEGTVPLNVTVAPFLMKVWPEPWNSEPVVTLSRPPTTVSVPSKVVDASRDNAAYGEFGRTVTAKALPNVAPEALIEAGRAKSVPPNVTCKSSSFGSLELMMGPPAAMTTWSPGCGTPSGSHEPLANQSPPALPVHVLVVTARSSDSEKSRRRRNRDLGQKEVSLGFCKNSLSG